jgi:hypothetical protein
MYNSQQGQEGEEVEVVGEGEVVGLRRIFGQRTVYVGEIDNVLGEMVILG